jgi:hypothetical protein
MKSSVSLALVLGLALPAAPLAQTRTSLHDWARVQHLDPGTRTTITLKRPSPNGTSVLDCFALTIDNDVATVLSLAAVSLPPSVRDALIETATRHPDRFLAAARGMRFALPHNVSLGPQGVFTLTGRAAALRDIIERVGRDDISSVTITRTRKRGSQAEVVRGAIAGFMVTLVAAAGGGTGPNFCTEHPQGCVPVAALGAAAIAGASYLGGHSRTIVDDVVVYQAARSTP